MFSMLVFMCRDPGNTTSKVSCCVEPSQCFKNSILNAIVKVPHALPLQMILTQKQKYSKSYKCLFCCNYAFTRRFDLHTFNAWVAFWLDFHFNTQITDRIWPYYRFQVVALFVCVHRPSSSLMRVFRDWLTNNIMHVLPERKSCSNGVVEGPDTDDGDEAGADEDNVQAEQQTVDDNPDH